MNTSDEWDEKRMDIVGSNGNDGLHYHNGWFKHDSSSTCPVPADTMVTVETWTPDNPTKRADLIDWRFVKFYRVEV